MMDLVIIGGGPAGLCAAVYAARAGLEGILLERDGIGGGQLSAAAQVDNFPGSPGIGGEILAEAMVNHALRLGLPLRAMEVRRVERDGDGFAVHCTGGTVAARNVVYAAGASPRRLGVPGEDRLAGKGVSYCANCDGALFRGTAVAVVGGGDTAVSDALVLSRHCDSVHILLRGSSFRATRALTDRLDTTANVTVYPNTTVSEVLGRERVEAIRIQAQAGEETLPVAGVFVAVGTMPQTGPVAHLGVCDADGYLLADETGRTAVPGLYAAGDVRRKPLRQIVTALADGANCVEAICHREL